MCSTWGWTAGPSPLNLHKHETSGPDLRLHICACPLHLFLELVGSTTDATLRIVRVSSNKQLVGCMAVFATYMQNLNQVVFFCHV